MTMTSQKARDIKRTVQFPPDELELLVETYRRFETFLPRETNEGQQHQIESSYIEKLIEDTRKGNSYAARELSEIFWDWRDARDYWREIDAILAAIPEEETQKSSREKLHRLYLMAIRSFGRAPINSPRNENLVDARHAIKMREAKKTKEDTDPAEIALRQAISECRGDDQITAHKEAEAISNDVNRRLRKLGHRSVSVDKIRRRLEKFYHS